MVDDANTDNFTYARYDDGDTVVVDALHIENGTLIRMISVVTDGSLCARTCYIYKISS